jgi:predicted RNA-binding protein with PIN domain
MALVRILIDGYSLLHHWPEIAPGAPRHSMVARDELIARVGKFQDCTGTPVTIVFDGANAPVGTQPPHSTRELEILFSKNGLTADDVIERATARLLAYGDVLVVTDDNAERETVIALGGSTSSCEEFKLQVAAALATFDEDLARWRRRQANPLNRAGL